MFANALHTVAMCLKLRDGFHFVNFLFGTIQVCGLRSLAKYVEPEAIVGATGIHSIRSCPNLGLRYMHAGVRFCHIAGMFSPSSFGWVISGGGGGS